MKEAILSQIKPFVFQDVTKAVAGMLDQYSLQIERYQQALMEISKVSESVDGAVFARDIAKAAIQP